MLNYLFLITYIINGIVPFSYSYIYQDLLFLGYAFFQSCFSFMILLHVYYHNTNEIYNIFDFYIIKFIFTFTYIPKCIIGFVYLYYNYNKIEYGFIIVSTIFLLFIEYITIIMIVEYFAKYKPIPVNTKKIENVMMDFYYFSYFVILTLIALAMAHFYVNIFIGLFLFVFVNYTYHYLKNTFRFIFVDFVLCFVLLYT